MSDGVRKMRGAGVAAAALLCLFAIAAPAADATYPGHPGVIVFNKIEFHGAGADLTGGLFAIRPGEQPRQLTTNPTDYSPSFAPDGSRLAFRRVNTPEPGVYVLELATGTTTRLTSRGDDLDPAFGPKGMIVFSRFVRASGSYDLVLRTRDGRLKRVTSGKAADEEPVFTPDGRRIVFFRRPGRAVALESRAEGSGRLFSIRVDGSGLKALKGVGEDGSSYDISPDGGRLLFFRIQGGNTIEEVTTTAWTQRLRGGRPSLLVSNASYPTFSPAGGSVAYSNHEGLWMLRADGRGAPTLLVDAKNFNDYRPGSSLVIQPAWQPLP